MVHVDNGTSARASPMKMRHDAWPIFALGTFGFRN